MRNHGMGSKKLNYRWKSSKTSHVKEPKNHPNTCAGGGAPRRCCGAARLCCGGTSRISASSSSDSDMSEQLSCMMSSFTHAMVQAKLEQMISERRAAREEAAAARRCVLLVAVEKATRDPRREFRDSLMEVIISKRLEDAKELRSLLNCYISVNPREHHGLILEVFHEVCCCLFS